jgi:hypothetical protein
MHNALVQAVHPKTDKDRDYVSWTLDAFKDMLQRRRRPGYYWDYVNNGCFKEVFRPWTMAPCVVKFVSQENETDEEKSLLYYAKEEGVAQFFIPTYFVDLSCPLDAEWLDEYSDVEDEDSDEIVYHTQQLISVQVQPVVRVDEDCAYMNYDSARDLEWKAADGNIVSNETMMTLARKIWNNEWIMKALAYYSAAELNQFAYFLDEYCVTDLHCGNVGYYKEQPIILDCMSRSLI